MVHPYLKRRNGEKVTYPAPDPQHGDPDELKQILSKTLGVPLFQEQAMRIAIEAAKFTPDEANQLRKAMATFRHAGTIHKFEDKMVNNLMARGYPETFAKNCFNQIKGFGDYGFPGKPRGELCQAGLCLVLAEAFSPRRFLLRASELAADGFLRAGADRL